MGQNIKLVISVMCRSALKSGFAKMAALYKNYNFPLRILSYLSTLPLAFWSCREHNRKEEQ